MDNPSMKPGLFSFAQRAPPTGSGPWEANANLLRLTGWLVVAGALLTVLSFVLGMMFVTAVASSVGGTALGGAIAMGALIVMVITLAIYAAALFWVSFTYFHWCNRDRRGYSHAFALGLVMAILGGLGALSGLMSVGTSFAVPVMGISSLLSLAVSAGYCILGIMILVNRNKPECQAAFGVTTAPPPGMAS